MTMTLTRQRFPALRADWADALPLATWGPSFGWDYSGDRPVTPRWRLARYQVLRFLRGYEARLRAIRAITTDPATSDSTTGTVWSMSRRMVPKAVALLLLAPLRQTWPEHTAMVDEMVMYDGAGDGYSWSSTFLHIPTGWRLGPVYIDRDGDTTY